MGIAGPSGGSLLNREGKSAQEGADPRQQACSSHRRVQRDLLKSHGWSQPPTDDYRTPRRCARPHTECTSCQRTGHVSSRHTQASVTEMFRRQSSVDAPSNAQTCPASMLRSVLGRADLHVQLYSDWTGTGPSTLTLSSPSKSAVLMCCGHRQSVLYAVGSTVQCDACLLVLLHLVGLRHRAVCQARLGCRSCHQI
jgi:hypothetical protein